MIARFVILGASGDLTSRYLMPAVARLLAAGSLADGPDLEILGVARDDWTTDAFGRRIAKGLDAYAGDVPKDVRDRLLGYLSYAKADVTDVGAMRGLLDPTRGPVVAYLALPPAVFAPAIETLRDIGLADGSRVVVEKPFGDSLASAQALNRLLHEAFDEEAVFRIDHFLGKQNVQNLLGVRFANRLFEPLWNSQHVERVEIRWDETLALEGRAGYYDRAGALKDMLQNHLLQLLALVAMEPPLSLSARDLRDRKVDALRAVRRLSREEVGAHTVRARYTAGRIGDLGVPSYVDEEGVDATRGTETFAQVTLFLDNWRWGGVPFVLRSGKALANHCREIRMHFKPVPHMAFGREGGTSANCLCITFDPDTMRLQINVNGPGDPLRLEPASLTMDLAKQEVDAYGRLLLDVLEGDATLSIRDDEAEEAWRIVAPILDGWRHDVVSMVEYEAGTSFQPE